MKTNLESERSHNQKATICWTSIKKLQTCPQVLYSNMWSLLQVISIIYLFLHLCGGQQYSNAASTLKQEEYAEEGQ